MLELIYQKEITKEGNDCKIYKSFLIVKVDGDCFLASKCAIYKGYMGTDSQSQSFVFDSFDEALNYIEKEASEERED